MILVHTSWSQNRGTCMLGFPGVAVQTYQPQMGTLKHLLVLFSGGNEGMNPINHPWWFPLRGPLGSSPRSLSIAPAKNAHTHIE